MRLKYIEFNGKHPKGYKHPEAGQPSRTYYDEPLSQWRSYGAKYPPGFLKCDVDDYDHKTGELVEPIQGKPRSEVITAMLDYTGTKYLKIPTDHGGHFYLGSPDDLERKSKYLNWICAVGIKMEWKFPESDDHMKLKVNGRMLERFGCQNLEDVDPLPKWLYPIQKSRDKPFYMHFPEGDRTQALGGYVRHLVQHKGFTPDEAFQTIRLMNEFVFENPIPERTLKDEILNDSTYEKLQDDYLTGTKKKNRKEVSLETFDDFLTESGITVRYNPMLNFMEWGEIPESYEKLTDLQNNMPIKIQDEYQKFLGRSVNIQTVRNYIRYVGDVNVHNPVKEYLTGGQWDKQDRFPEVFQILNVQDDFQKTLIRKFFYQAAAMAFNSLQDPFQAEGVLILQGAEGIGKSRFFELMSPSPLWKRSFYQDFDTNKKDKLIETTSGFIVEFAEIDRTFRSNRSDFKGFVTSPTDDVRKPYAMEAVTTPRTTVYCGTTNAATFLTKDTGYRRWWVIPVSGIDLKAMETFREPGNLSQFWYQCYYTWNNNRNCFRLTHQEQTQLKAVNMSYMDLPPAAEAILDGLDFDSPREWAWHTSTEIRTNYGYAISSFRAQDIGAAMATVMEIEPRVKKKTVHHANKYYVPPAMRDLSPDEVTAGIEG